MGSHQDVTWLDYVKFGLLIAALVLAVGVPFKIFLHFFNDKWPPLVVLSIGLGVSWTLMVWEINEKQKRPSSGSHGVNSKA